MFKLPYTNTDGLPVSKSIQTVDDIIHYCNELTDLHEIYDIFEEYYGEDRVDIQYINQETLDQTIRLTLLRVSQIILVPKQKSLQTPDINRELVVA